MSWWGQEHIIGDGPLDIMSGAIEQTIAEYRSEIGRDPTEAEIKLVFTSAFAGFEEVEVPKTPGH